jgi:periplasmic divalent cation tolerance protein
VIQTASFAIVLTTLPADGDVESLARALVDERLAACVNILPAMQSIYRWEGKVEQASERQLIIKTAAAQVEDLKARIAALHPYDVPEMLVLPVSGGSEGYLQWIRDSVGTPSL